MPVNFDGTRSGFSTAALVRSPEQLTGAEQTPSTTAQSGPSPYAETPAGSSRRGVTSVTPVTRVSPTASTLLNHKALNRTNAPDLDHVDARRRLLRHVPCGTVIAHDGWPPPHAATASGLSLYASSLRDSAYRAVSADDHVTPECERTQQAAPPSSRLRPLSGTGRPTRPRDHIGQDPDHSRASNPVKAETGTVCAGQRRAASVPPADEEPAGRPALSG
jgi:hypothetical protein